VAIYALGDSAVLACENTCDTTVDCITLSLEADEETLEETCFIYRFPFDPNSFECNADIVPLTTETDIYVNLCPSVD
jgi:hypothetical protein